MQGFFNTSPETRHLKSLLRGNKLVQCRTLRLDLDARASLGHAFSNIAQQF